MKFTITFALGLLFMGFSVKAQNKHFTTEGVVEYEKTINMFAIMKKEVNKDNEVFMQPAYDQYVKTKPQFIKMKSTLTFSKDQALFSPIEDPDNSAGFDNAIVGQRTTIFTDFSTETIIAQKRVFEATFLLKDSVRKIKWKITDERRDIAGYSCRRANGLVLDSIYVVAFYTDEIPVSGGPESFNGLPGMILGVALPHENITWFATKVTDQTIQPAAIKPPTKGKPTNAKQFKETLLSIMKDWGSMGQTNVKGFML